DEEATPDEVARRKLIRRALELGQAVTQDEEADASRNSARATSCSRLCVPIYVRGTAVVCLYVTHEHIRGLFGTDEECLADFIAHLAGAALENADGFDQLTQLNNTLEQRVAERTAAAENRAQELARTNQQLEQFAAELRRADEELRVAKDAA